MSIVREAVCVNVARFLSERADAFPQQVAVKALSAGNTYKSYTFKQVEYASNRFANKLVAQGVTRGKRVLLLVKPGVDLILITFALFKVGAVPVIIDPGMGIRNFLKCVKTSRPEALIGIPEALRLSRVFFPYFRKMVARIKVRVGSLVPLLDEAGTCSFKGAEMYADTLAAIVFTSGSTGPPKGVEYLHGMFEAQVRAIREQYGIQAGEVDLPMLPLFALFNPALGVTTVVPPINPRCPAKMDPGAIVQAINVNKVTTSFGAPVLWEKVVGYCEAHRVTLPSLKRVLMAGTSVSPRLIKRFRDVIPDCEVHVPYGATEALPMLSISSTEVLNEEAPLVKEGKGTCLGKALPGVKAKVVAIKKGPIVAIGDIEELAAGEVGEIIVQGPTVTRAYHRLKEATARAKIQEGKYLWHRMGDLGYKDRDDNFWFCGRMAERVVTAEGVYFPDCCEEIINQHEKVFRSALIGLGAGEKQTPAIVIEPKKGCWPRSRKAKKAFLAEIKTFAKQFSETSAIEHFFLYRHFPVDVRHNAKIHRLKLSRYFS